MTRATVSWPDRWAERMRTYQRVLDCSECKTQVTLTYDERYLQRCRQCISNAPLRKRVRTAATRQVAIAVMAGILPRLDGSVACVDCGKPATDYDHRDYGKPLEVEPTCHSCNIKRGPAVWRKPASSKAAA